MTALRRGLPVAGAKGSYDTQGNEIIETVTPRHFTATLVPLHFALSLSIANLLVPDLDRPFGGLNQIPRKILQHAPPTPGYDVNPSPFN